jgi:hypothetical protein
MRKSAKSTTTTDKKSKGFIDEKKAAMKERLHAIITDLNENLIRILLTCHFAPFSFDVVIELGLTRTNERPGNMGRVLRTRPIFPVPFRELRKS